MSSDSTDNRSNANATAVNVPTSRWERNNQSARSPTARPRTGDTSASVSRHTRQSRDRCASTTCACDGDADDTDSSFAVADGRGGSGGNWEGIDTGAPEGNGEVGSGYPPAINGVATDTDCEDQLDPAWEPECPAEADTPADAPDPIDDDSPSCTGTATTCTSPNPADWST